MKHSKDAILVTHIGGLPRPPHLREVLLAKDKGQPLDPKAFEATVHQSVADAVRRQARVGITVVNDGEQSKIGYSQYVKDRLTGFGGRDTSPTKRLGEELEFPDFFASQQRSRAQSRACCDGPIGWKDFAAVEMDIRNLKVAVANEKVADVFMSANSPGNMLRQLPNRYYRSDDEYLEAAANAMKREYEAITNAGFVLQVDCPDLASTGGRDGAVLTSLAAFRKEVSRNIEVLNHATRDIRPESIRIHVCWGRPEVPHTRDAELKDLIDLLLKARATAITIVAANGRHEHEWTIWKGAKIPDGLVVIPGVIDNTTNIVEHPETVAERIVRYASVVGRENVIAGVDCGFAPMIDDVDPAIAWAKLEAMGHGATLATKELWRK